MLTLACLVMAAPWFAYAAVSLMAAGSTTPIDWVPATFLARRDYDSFTAAFSSGDVVVASWPDCRLGSPAVAKVLNAAASADASQNAGERWFDEVTSGGTIVDQLTAPPLSLDRQTATERLRGLLIGPDGQQTCIVFACSSAGLAERRKVVAWIRETIIREAGISVAALHLAGPVINNVAVDEASDESLGVYGGPAAAIVFVLTWIALRSFRYAAVVFCLSLGCVGLTFASLAAWGDQMNPVLIVMPLLVLTLGVSAGIHLVNYLVEAQQEDRPAIALAVRTAWRPCSLSASTTALGLLSLVVSDLEPIRVFGFHAAVGVLGTLALNMLVLPGLFTRWPLLRPAGPPHRGAPCAGLVSRRAELIATTAVVVIALAGIGVTGVRTSVGIGTLFPPDSRVITDTAWLEEHVGPLAPVEVVLRFADTDELRAVERLDIVRDVAAALQQLPAVSRTVSAELFAPAETEVAAARRVARKAILARRLASSLTRLPDMRLIRDEPDGGQLWRVTARTSALAGLDYGLFLDDVRRRVEPVMTAHGGTQRGISASYTGAMPLINAIQRSLLRDLFVSFLTACLVISLVTVIAARGLAAGLLAMIPNLFPMLILFGLLGWQGATLDIGSVMTASVALGMAVDGTFHFLTSFRRALPTQPGRAGRVTATAAAYRQTAPAVLQTALVCGIGILAFVPSGFTPTRQFAIMLAVLVALALVGDLIVLPAVLISPVGRLFRRSNGPLPPEGLSPPDRRCQGK
jgi:predicted RND superfamily exporter protein